MEALGLESADKDPAKLEQRLLAAVSDLQLAQKERDEFRDQMLRTNEAVLRYLKTSQGGDAQARMDVEAQLRGSNQLVSRSAGLGPAAPEGEPSLMDGSVISVKVFCSREHRREAGRENRDAAARAAGRSKDRDAARG
jgi:hypothetical protein